MTGKHMYYSQCYYSTAMDLISYSFAPLILFRVPYTLDLLLYYLSSANGTGGVRIFELLKGFKQFVFKLLYSAQSTVVFVILYKNDN